MSWAGDLYAAVDRKESATFAAAFTPDGSFQFGNWPAAEGRAAIEALCDQFFASLGGLHHVIRREYRDGDARLLEFEVTYTRLDGSTVSLPALTRFIMDGDLAKYSQVFMDVTPLYAPAE